MSANPTQDLVVEGIGTVPVATSDAGSGHPFLLLHGGAGPQSVGSFAELLATSGNARVISPTHPGFGGTPRPESLDSIARLARVYVVLLERLDVHDVTVVGNSIGAWIAAEMALVDSSRISDVVLVDGVGIDVPGQPIADFFSLTLEQVGQLSYHDPGRFRIDPATMPEAQRAAIPGNRASLATYAGSSMNDASLRGRLAGIAVPTLVVWGDSDRIASPDYGRALAAAIPGAEFVLLQATGHLPQIETPDQLLTEIRRFVDANAANRTALSP
jgi:pimeloyl-ACP methyl ester carboxylesterase